MLIPEGVQDEDHGDEDMPQPRDRGMKRPPDGDCADDDDDNTIFQLLHEQPGKSMEAKSRLVVADDLIELPLPEQIELRTAGRIVNLKSWIRARFTKHRLCIVSSSKDLASTGADLRRIGMGKSLIAGGWTRSELMVSKTVGLLEDSLRKVVMILLWKKVHDLQERLTIPRTERSSAAPPRITRWLW